MSSKVDKPLYLSNSSQSECHVLYNCRQNIELSNSAMMTEEQVVKARKKSRACKRRDRERMLKLYRTKNTRKDGQND